MLLDGTHTVTICASAPGYEDGCDTLIITDDEVVDFGDAPDTGVGTGSGNYNTLSTDNGPNHIIVAGLFLGATVDADDGTLQNATANADDVDGALPDDEDGLNNPAADLILTIGAAPTVNVIVTNTSGSPATLFGWIDMGPGSRLPRVTSLGSPRPPRRRPRRDPRGPG